VSNLEKLLSPTMLAYLERQPSQVYSTAALALHDYLEGDGIEDLDEHEQDKVRTATWGLVVAEANALLPPLTWHERWLPHDLKEKWVGYAVTLVWGGMFVVGIPVAAFQAWWPLGIFVLLAYAVGLAFFVEESKR
jgi:hypothetical protein